MFSFDLRQKKQQSRHETQYLTFENSGTTAEIGSARSQNNVEE